MAADDQKQSRSTVFIGRPFLAPAHASLAIAIIATGLVYLDQTAITIILPAIQRDLVVALAELQWIVNVYILFMTAPLLLFGVLGDRAGRVRVYLIGMALFGIASLACGLTPYFPALVFLRALQGVGAAMIVAVGLAILNFHTPPNQRARAIGAWASFTSMIIALGPTVAGALARWLDWQAVFMINVPFALVGLIIARQFVPENRNEAASLSSLDWLSTAQLLFGMGCLLFGVVTFSAEWEIVDTTIAGFVITGIGILNMWWFFRRQITHPHSLIPAEVFRYRRFIAINLITTLQWLAISGAFFLLPLYLQWTQGYTMLETGLSLLPISGMVILVSRQSGRFADRYGAMPPMAAGVTCLGLAMLWFAQTPDFSNFRTDLLPQTLLYGLGLGSLIAPLTAVAMNALPDRFSGIASGVNNTASRISTMIAIALTASIMVTLFYPAFATGVTALEITEQQRLALLYQAPALGNISLEGIEDLQLKESIQAVIAQAIGRGFTGLMWINASLSGLSLVLILLLHWRNPSERRVFW